MLKDRNRQEMKHLVKNIREDHGVELVAQMNKMQKLGSQNPAASPEFQ